ncbi:UNVERIFIED_CONTAM: hypothetical protein HDU68_006095 [Siphonaria sp. JEL0065]|nr:hypothetical protein HDU68_006095 [Siphonaria sp. JEL0065]
MQVLRLLQFTSSVRTLATPLGRCYGTGKSRLPDPELLRQLQIPSFKEFRAALKSERNKTLPSSHGRSAKPNLQPIPRTSNQLPSYSKETQDLLTSKASTASGLSDLELNAIQSLLSTDIATQRRLPTHTTYNMLDGSEKQLLKIEESYISQFPMPEYGSTRQERESEQVARLIQRVKMGENLETMSLEQITSVIRVNALLGRVEEAQEAFTLIRESGDGRVPDTIAINTLMDAYARVGDYRNAARVFKEFYNGTAKPDHVSYSILIKACVYAGKLRSAFDVYEAMKAKQINPSLPIYTTLIKGCIDTKDIPRAWTTFNHMYEEICQPDVTTYSLMIHACALDNNAERALELFQQMHERGLVATEVTYTSLLQACGSRKDYYGEVWGLVGQMVDQGWKVNLVACKVLMRVCASQGDLGRLRTVWNWVVAQAGNGDKSMKPDASVYRSMFHALGQCVRVSRRISRRTPSSLTEPFSPYADQAEQTTTDTPAPISSTANALVTQQPSYTFIEPITPQHALQHLHLSNTETTTHAIIADASCLWENALATLEKEQITSEVVDAYLAIYCAAPGNIVAASKALEIYDSMYSKQAQSPPPSSDSSEKSVSDVSSVSDAVVSTLPSPENSVELNSTVEKEAVTEKANTEASVIVEFDPAYAEAPSKSVASEAILKTDFASIDTPSTPKPSEPAETIVSNSQTSSSSSEDATSSSSSTALTIPRTGWTYQFMLDIVTKDKKLMRSRGVEIWDDYLAWDTDKERALAGLTPSEKELVRVNEGRGRDAMKKSFVLMARGYSKVNEITKALDTIEAATIFRDDPSYLPAIVFNDVSSLLDKVRDLAEEGNLVPAKRLKELCPPPPPKTADEEVKEMLKNKWAGGKNWWGWESLGIDENIRRKMIRKQQKESDRVKAYWANKGRKK